MTIIAAIHEPGVGTWIGGDRRMTANNEIVSDDCDKWLIGNGWAVAFAADHRAQALSEHADVMKMVEHADDPPWEIASRIRSVLDQDGWRGSDAKGSKDYSACLVIASAQAAWLCWGCMTPIRMPLGAMAVAGSGSDFARGAAHAMRGMPPEKILRAAIDAAIAFDTGCGGSPYIHLLKAE